LPFRGVAPDLRQPQLQVMLSAARKPVRAENEAWPSVTVVQILA
jgi:hypothetical protein